MVKISKISISSVKGESLRGTPLADQILALDRKNMEATLKAVGREFPEQRRRETLFHPSNQMLLAMRGQELVGYVDFCDDAADPDALYLSSIQIEPGSRGGAVFKLLLSNLMIHLRSRDFRTIKTHIQKSNVHMIAIAKKAGFTLQENPKNSGTLAVFADRSLLDSPKFKRYRQLS